MSQQIINVGSAPNDGTGDLLRNSQIKANANFTELYNGAGIDSVEREEFVWTTGAQTFTLAELPTNIVFVSVNGQVLDASQYTQVLSVITITETLDVDDNIIIVYSFKTAVMLDLINRTGWASYVSKTHSVGTPLVITAATDTVLPIEAVTVIDGQKPDDIKTFYFAKQLNLIAPAVGFIEGENILGGTSGATGKIAEVTGSIIRITHLVGTFVAETITGVTSGASGVISTVSDGKITGREGDNIDFMIFFKAVSTNNDQWLDVWINIGGSIGELYRQTYTFPKGIGFERGILYSIPSGYTLDTWENNGATIYVRSSHTMNIVTPISINLDRSHRAI